VASRSVSGVGLSIGIGSKQAWCRTPDGRIVFLSRDGLYTVHPLERHAEPLSRDRLPQELLGAVSNTNNVVCMEYDVRGQGVHILITAKDRTFGHSQHWWLGWQDGAFFPVRLSYAHDPYVATFDAKSNQVILGCRDGYLRTFQEGLTTDDGTSIASRVMIGPIRFGKSGMHEGVLNQLHVTLAEGSDDTVLSVLTGDTPEGALRAAAGFTQTLSAGHNTLRPRVRGASGFLRLHSGTGRWALEGMSAVIGEGGQIR